MNVLFWGTPQTAVPFLNQLSKSHKIVCAVTRPDKPSSRGQKIQKSPVKLAAEQNNIPVLAPVKLKDPEFLNQLESFKAEAAIVVAYGRILPPEVIRLFPKGIYNIHFSLLPELRGAAPIQWSIMNGLEKTGVTSFRISEGLDEGNILAQKELALDPKENALGLEQKLIALGLHAMEETLAKIESGNIEGIPQSASSTHAPLIKKDNLPIQWSQDAALIDRQIRAFIKEGVFAKLPDGKTLKITQAEPLPSSETLPPGTVLRIERGVGFVIKCGKDSLRVTRCQPEGRKEMDAWSFLQGNKLEPGTRFE